MALARKLFVNWHTRRRQKNDLSASPDPVQTLTFGKYEQLPLEVVIIEPDSTRGGLNDFTRLDITDLGLKVIINDTLDDASPLVELSGVDVTKDTGRRAFLGTLNLNTAGMTSYIGSTDKTPYFLVLIYDGTNWVPVLQETCSVLVTAATQTTVSPDPSRQYMDYNENLGVFVPRVMGPGESIVIPSLNGLYRRIIGCNDDGTARDDIETT